jgi:hypothetical protein
MSLRMAWLVIALAGMAMAAQAQTEAPSDLELGAAYCLGRMQGESTTEFMSQTINIDPDCKLSTAPNAVAACRKMQQLGREAIRAEHQDFQRLQSYLVAKGYAAIPSKTAPDMMAISRGRADAAGWKALTDSSATQACFSHCSLDTGCIAQCTMQLDADGLGARMAKCQGVLQAIPF